jgi:hypothetical protein
MEFLGLKTKMKMKKGEIDKVMMRVSSQLLTEMESQESYVPHISRFSKMVNEFFKPFRKSTFTYLILFSKFPESFTESDQCVIFNVGQRVENDILIRFRHFQSNQKRVSMFRASVHTSFIVDSVLRLTKLELDGALGNDKYPNDFFIDLIFTDARNHQSLLKCPVD